MNVTESEFLVLRQTIATRGTVRVALLPATLLAWAVLLMISPPVAGLVASLPLLVLAAGFEAIHALHVGVERIGRYLQVFYEGSPDGPRWESTAMAVGPVLPGGGVDPLFTVIFVVATALNLLSALAMRPNAIELAVVGVLHAIFLVRLVRARIAAARQRAVELESFRALK